jgi:biotin transport system substrate-specific component
MIFLASVAIFIPQDFFMDHVLAVLTFAYVDRLMRERGIEL